MKAQLLRGARLPAAGLRSTDDAAVSLRGGRGPLVVFIVHAPDCAGCLDYIRRLAAHAERIAEWGTTMSVVAAATAAETEELRNAAGERLRVLLDPDRLLTGEKATVLIADEWGEIFFAAEADEAHDLPAPEEIADWGRFIAVQCPECEQPEGAWRTV